MGIIIKQSIKGTIWSYLGVVIGFVTTSYLFPEYLTTNTVGLFGLLLAWTGLSAQIASLGFNGITLRLFPYFRDKDEGHNGYLFIAFMVMMVGFGLFLIFYFIFSPWLVENNIEKSQLFSKYVYLLIPLTFFTLLFNLLDNFNKLLYNAVFGTFLIEFLQRLLILISVLIFIFGWINLNSLILFYTTAVCAKGVIIFLFLFFKGEINLNPKLKFIEKNLKAEMFNVAIYSILTGVGGSIVFSIDKIIINQMLGLSATGVYTIAFFFGTLVVIPSRPLLRISGTLIADAWKRNDVDYISDIYKRSCLNQFIIAAFLFGGIWINIDNILVILGPDYAEGKWVIFFVGLGYLIDMATGANAQIIGYSKYYKVALLFLLVLIILVFSLMYFLIPVWGIVGAAVAIALSFFINNLMRFVYLFRKFGMQPFTPHFFIVILAFLFAYFAGVFIPRVELIYDILVKGTIFTIVFFSIIIGFRVSTDINDTLLSIFNKLKNLIRG